MNTETDFQPITSSDVRDIASYLGVACSYNWDKSGMRLGVVDGNLIVVLSSSPRFVTDFKVHLLSLDQLTDEQVIDLAMLAGCKQDKDWYVRRAVDFLDLRTGSIYGDADFEVYFNTGTLYRPKYTTDCCHNTQYEDINPAPLYRKLQEWGFYVPGLIDEKYVQIIQPAKPDQ